MSAPAIAYIKSWDRIRHHQLTIMDGDVGHWTELYSSSYNPVDNDNHIVESGDIGYGTVYSTHPPADPADVDGFFNSIMPTDFPHVAPLSDTPYVDVLYLPRPGNRSINQRQQPNPQLVINTKLDHQINDSESSTAPSTSLSKLLGTPSVQSYPGLHPQVHTSSPWSAPIEGGTQRFKDFETMSPLSLSPMSHYPSKSGGDNIFDFPIPFLPTDHDIVTQVPMPHILEWKSVIERCGTNDFVPQTVYQPFTEADRKRYIQDVELQKTIFFQLNGSSELGISLDDALNLRLGHLKDKDDRMFVGCGPSVSIRIQWPGYPPWSKQIPTMDFRNPKGPITRAKLAKNIASCIRRFAKHVQDKPMEAESDRNWKIGKRHIKVEDLVVVSLHHVSKGSWQPQLRLLSSGPFPTLSRQWDKSLLLVSP